jgi:hypothetical protein
MHKATEKFWEKYRNLPLGIQRIADKNFELLKTNPKHPSLHFKKIDKFWSVRIGLTHRALAVGDNDDYIWVWIGTHEDYERQVK